MRGLDRRFILAGAASALALAGSRPLRAAVPTPGQSEGPFYPREEDFPADLDNDLVRITGAVEDAGGRLLHLTGSVTDPAGAPLDGALVEIWQCDVNGRYRHGRDWSLFRDRDPFFQGYGKAATGPDGRYAFRTILPVPYPGRPPHIHFKAHDPRDGSILTTQMYVAGDHRNVDDGSFGSLSAEQQKAVAVVMTEGDDRAFRGEFQIVL